MFLCTIYLQMADPFSISPASNADIPELERLINRAYRGEASKKGWTTEAHLLEGELRTDQTSILALLQKKGAIILKYCDEKGLINGCVYLEKQEENLYLGMLTVSPEIQSKGMGKKLLFASEEYARQQKCNCIIMNVISARHELIAWYERHGYQKNGETKPFPTDNQFGIPTRPLEFIVLEKIITP